MQIRSYPYPAHFTESVFKKICSEHGGIIQSLLVSTLQYAEGFHIKSVAAQMPAYHKVLLHPDVQVQYHLSGYGTFHEEAMIRLVGEAIERYSLMVGPYPYQNEIQYATYHEMERNGKVIPWEYLTLYTENDYAKLNKGSYKDHRPLKKDDVIAWLSCPSLLYPNQTIWVPMQLLFVGYKASRLKKEQLFAPAFSTGTAAHRSLEHALLNAILEIVEIDAVMVQWYTQRKAPQILLDDITLLQHYGQLFSKDSDIEVLAMDLRILDEIQANVFGVVLLNRQDTRPLVSYGAQADLDPASAFHRSLMEAMAIRFLGIYGPLYSPNEYLAPITNEFTDLDTNVSFFANPEDAATKRGIIQDLIQGKKLLSSFPHFDTLDTKQNLLNLLTQLKKISEYAVYLDVTPPEVREHGWYVMRAIVPELVTMCFPGVPYSQHPRFQKFGGIKTQCPHPLP